MDAAEVVARAGGKVIDEAAGMLLIEASSATARHLPHLLPDWQVCLETITPVPAVPRPEPGSTVRNRHR